MIYNVLVTLLDDNGEPYPIRGSDETLELAIKDALKSLLPEDVKRPKAGDVVVVLNEGSGETFTYTIPESN